jgi:Trk-type K+ transport system membrane component
MVSIRGALPLLGLQQEVLADWSATCGRWNGAFNAVSAFNNSGMSLLDQNMVAQT